MKPVWLFGYGSLIWRPDFEFLSSRIARVDGWSRRFWQGSHDHRGVPEAPGRVVTLIPEPGAQCGGMAFEIDAKLAAEIFTALDYREKNGYDRCRAPLIFDDSPGADPTSGTAQSGEEGKGIFYVANGNNPAFLGPASALDIARQISRSQGPSGPNDEYLRNLANAWRQHGIADDHVFEIEAELNRLSRPAGNL